MTRRKPVFVTCSWPSCVRTRWYPLLGDRLCAKHWYCLHGLDAHAAEAATRAIDADDILNAKVARLGESTHERELR